MQKGNLTQAEAIEIVGSDAVKHVQNANCDFTNRVQTDGDDSVEFSAEVKCKDTEDRNVTLVAYYYQTPDALDAAGDDLSNLEWQVAGYEVI